MVSFSILSLWRMVVIVGRLDRITNGKSLNDVNFVVFLCVYGFSLTVEENGSQEEG